MVTSVDKKIVLAAIVGYDGPWNAPYKEYEKTYAEEKDPIINDYMVERIAREMLADGSSRLTLYTMIKDLVDRLKGGFPQLIDNVPWTSDDIFDVMQMVGKKLLPMLEKKLGGRKVFCRMYEDGILEFRLER